MGFVHGSHPNHGAHSIVSLFQNAECQIHGSRFMLDKGDFKDGVSSLSGIRFAQRCGRSHQQHRKRTDADSSCVTQHKASSNAFKADDPMNRMAGIYLADRQEAGASVPATGKAAPFCQKATDRCTGKEKIALVCRRRPKRKLCSSIAAVLKRWIGHARAGSFLALQVPCRAAGSEHHANQNTMRGPNPD
jgi:hypothetical protein